MIQDMSLEELVELANLVYGHRDVYEHFGITYELLTNTTVGLMFLDAIKNVKKDVRFNN